MQTKTNMPKQKFVYIVSSGDYSDHSVRKCFSTKELADQYAKVLRTTSSYPNDADVEKRTIDDPENEWVAIRVRMCRDGTVPPGDIGVEKIVKYGNNYGDNNGNGFGYFDYADCLVWYVQTDDEERAVKVVAEKRAILLAAGLWGDDKAAKVARTL